MTTKVINEEDDAMSDALISLKKARPSVFLDLKMDSKMFRKKTNFRLGNKEKVSISSSGSNTRMSRPLSPDQPQKGKKLDTVAS